MQHFPIFLDLKGARVVLSGGGEAALAKLRLLLKTEARIDVFAPDASADIRSLAGAHRLTLTPRPLASGDAAGAALFYAADEDADEDARTAAIARSEGVLTNIVDNLHDSQFITPAMVDRDPVVVAIGTEGAAPVLARAIKRDLEERLSPRLGLLARIGKAFRPMAEKLPIGRARRDFWADFYFDAGPRAAEAEGAPGVETALHQLLNRHLAKGTVQGHVDFVGAGPGDPELLTMKARTALDKADVILHDRLIAAPILELARREAILVEVGKTGFGQSMKQHEINDLIVEHAQNGGHVVRLKSGDPTIFGRLDEEVEAVDAAGLPWRIVPGITAASAAVAAMGQSLTRRGRNASVRFLTGHDMLGFADHDWRALAQPGEVVAIYMGKRATRFVQGRLMMQGADPATPVSFVEHASRPDQRIVAATLADMTKAATNAAFQGPVLTFFGLAPRAAVALAPDYEQEIAL